MTVFLLQVMALRRALPHLALFGQLIKPLGATVLMMAFAWLSRGGILAYTILGSAGVYLGCLIASQAIGRDEWALVHEFWRRRVPDKQAA